MTADPLYARLRSNHAPEWLDFAGRRAFHDILAASAVRLLEFHEVYVSIVAASLADWRKHRLGREYLLLLSRMLSDCGVPKATRRRLLGLNREKVS